MGTIAICLGSKDPHRGKMKFFNILATQINIMYICHTPLTLWTNLPPSLQKIQKEKPFSKSNSRNLAGLLNSHINFCLPMNGNKFISACLKVRLTKLFKTLPAAILVFNFLCLGSDKIASTENER